MSDTIRRSPRPHVSQPADILYKSGLPSEPTARESGPRKGDEFGHLIRAWSGLARAEILVGFGTLVALVSACLPLNDVSKMPIRSVEQAPLSVNAEVGALSPPLFEQEKINSLTLEIQPMGAAQLSQEAYNHVKDFLVRELAWEPGQVSITVNPSISNYEDPYSEPGRLSLRWAREVEKRIRKRRPTGKQGALFLLISDARSVDQTDTARPFGLAHRATSLILYHPAIADASGGEGQPLRWRLEAAVVEHELGHLLGLVNTGGRKPRTTDITKEEMSTSEALHEAADSPTHCAHQKCLMHASTLGALSLATEKTADQMPELCEKCREAISRFKAKE